MLSPKAFSFTIQISEGHHADPEAIQLCGRVAAALYELGQETRYADAFCILDGRMMILRLSVKIGNRARTAEHAISMDTVMGTREDPHIWSVQLVRFALAEFNKPGAQLK